MWLLWQDSFQELASANDGAASAAVLARDPLPPVSICPASLVARSLRKIHLHLLL